VANAAHSVIFVIGDALLEAIERSRHVAVARAQEAWRKLQQLAAAPPGVELVAPDGSKYTGLVVIERSRAVLLIALHHPPQPPRPRAAEVDWGNHVRHPSFSEEDLVQDERNPLYRR
jgi:hypothetical protein